MYSRILRILRTFRTFPLLIIVTALLVVSGCESHRHYVADTDPKAPPPPSMQGYGEFFGGKLMVEASLGRGFRMRPGGMKNYAGKHRRGGGGGDGGEGLGEDDGGDSFDDVYYVSQEESDQYFIPRMSNSTLPPVALRVRVTNQMQQPVEVVFLECNSSLGNFAVRPEKITVAAGETGSPDPMTSLLGVATDEIKLTIGLSVGGVKETKIITLRAIKTAAPVAPVAPAATAGKQGAPTPPP